MGEWKEYKLADLANLRNGKGLNNKFYTDFGKSGVWGANGQIASTNEVLNSDPVIVIGRVGAYCGSIHMAEGNNWVTDNAIQATPKNDTDLNFLYYLLKSLNVSRAATGSAQPLITQSGIGVLECKAPSPKIQKEVASILSSLDDKIELNRKMNETLEEMARAIFKSWFVDFDPVHAKARGEEPSGMPDEIASLFPSEFVHSEQLNNPIPKGWEVKSLGDVFEALGGGTPSTKEPEYWVNGIYHWATPKDLSNLNEPIILTTERMLTEKGLNKISSGLLPKGTVLLSSRAPIGYVAISETPIAVNQGFIAIKENETFSKYFIYFWCKENIELIIANANGSTFLEISKKNFRNINSVFPVDEKIISEFTSIVEPIFQLIQKI